MRRSWRVAAIDVAKNSGMVCTRIPHENNPRHRTTTVWNVSARTNTIMNLAEQVAAEEIAAEEIAAEEIAAEEIERLRNQLHP